MQITQQDTFDRLTCDLIDEDGDLNWFDEHGLYHREDGPALIFTESGTRHWFNHGIRHRIDGPAIIHGDGHVEYWIDGESMDEAQFNAKVPK